MDKNFKAKTIAVYGVNEKSGKSTTAKELSGFYQIGGKKALLVDFTLGRSGFYYAMGLSGPKDLSDWVKDIVKKLRKSPWHAIVYSPEEVLGYTYAHVTGLRVLSCRQADIPEQMHEVVGVILNALTRCDFDVMVFDLNASVRDYNIRVLDAVDTVLLVTDTYRYDVIEVKMVMERLKDAGCRMEHFKVVFNKKPAFFDDTPLQIAEEFNLPMAGSLPDYPELSRNFLANAESINEYSTAMKNLIAGL
ncbi:MAG: hypothetical protein K6T65_01670 [Peptococcaceae bacterium]|nr:hypothetical protein [Peptococcaceae bacterium]